MTMQTLGTADVFDGMSAEGRTLDAHKLLDQDEAVRLQAHEIGFRTSGRRLRPAGADGQADRRRVAATRLVPYYLRTYALPPDPVFVNHIRQRRYQAPTVDPARKQATQAVSGGNRRLAAG